MFSINEYINGNGDLKAAFGWPSGTSVEQQKENMISSLQHYARPQIQSVQKEDEQDIAAELSSSLYSDTEFEESDSFQVFDDINNA